MRDTLREEDFIARLGGDEFVAVIYPVILENEIDELARRLINTLQAPFQIAEEQIQIGCSIGIAYAHENAYDARTLVNTADQAMYKAKKAGGNQYKIAL